MSGMIPETEKNQQDAVDLVLQGTKKYVKVLKEGVEINEEVIDSNSVWWKTQLVNSPTFGLLAFELENLESFAQQAFNYMSPERAEIIGRQILDFCLSIRRAIDAKSSETKMDKNNNQNSLIDRVMRMKQERYISIKDDMKKNGLAGFIGGKEATN